MALTDPAIRSYTFPGSMVADSAIKTSVATSNGGPAVYLGGALNGSVGGTVMTPMRTLLVTTVASVASYLLGGTITITGRDVNNAVQTEVFVIGNANGGESLLGVKYFKSVTQISVDQAQQDNLGHFKFGVSGALVNARQIRCGTGGDLHVSYADGSIDTIKKVIVGEAIPAQVKAIYGDSTVADITAFI